MKQMKKLRHVVELDERLGELLREKKIEDEAIEHTIDQVLMIIDKLYCTARDRYPKAEHMKTARNELMMCRQAILDLKGGEKE